ncbi:primosomal protein N' [Candidatus Berkelbacteria bacterium RBG_13_40_8]|uniref:Probable replication restart protein PriA n=1 Tax=Candidatus Berkelbacteria bacterium RBG_13_40_8 TaxID=1797467 RepID=A0A1F5DMQ4_9BACT|nr:MAG: primosomal protein N' [Candidatus Berkelbacteria bacterium RBG_13_40_8]
MQIAKIVPNVKTRDEGVFDYAIPPEILPMIKIGVLVEIPFHGRNIEGIVIDIKRTSPIPNLKEIVKVIDSRPVVDEIHIKLAQWMSDYYLEPFSKCLFENIVPVAKRSVFSESNHISFSARAENAKKIKNNSYRYLALGDFQYRLKIYLKAIEKTISRKKQVIVLVPNLETIPYFVRHINSSISILHSGLTRTQRYLEWQRIREGKVNIIVGSNSALFAPTADLGLIVIDQEENETYKSYQSPRFHAVKTAEKLAEIFGANLILGSISPRVETYFDALKGGFKILKDKDDKKDITTVDMNFEKGILSQPLQKAIEETLEQKKKVILVLNRKGEGTKFSCADCGWILKCEKCGLPLIPQKTDSVCYNCEKNFTLPESCPKCRGINLKPFGMGTKKLEKFVKDFWPKAKTVIIEKNSYDDTHDFDIAIATSFALKFSFSNVGLVGIIDADQPLNFPDFHSAEKTFVTFFKFLLIGERGILQTHLPENHVIRSLAKMKYDNFFLDELENRRKSSFPPFTHLTRLLYKNADEEICRKETERVFKLLHAKRYTLNAILGPAPCFIKKERNKFRYQIIIKSPSLISHYSSLIAIIRSLPKGWIVDVDPVNLL